MLRVCVCVARLCPTLVAPTFGSVNNATGVTGDIRTFSCDQGWALVGSFSTTCLTTSLWSNPTPFCNRKRAFQFFSSAMCFGQLICVQPWLHRHLALSTMLLELLMTSGRFPAIPVTLCKAAV